MSHLIEIRDLKKIYSAGEEPVAALDGVSLEIDNGEFVAIMGLIALGQYIIVELGGDIFRTEPLMALEWVLVIVPTMLIAVGGNLFIYLFRRYKR